MQMIFLSRLCPFFILALSCLHLTAQDEQINYLVSAYDDDFIEWEFWDAQEERIGSLEMSSPLRRDWTSWTYRLGDDSGDIRQKWSDNPTVWELVGYDGVITMRTQWGRDFSTWRIDAPDGKYILQSRFRNDGNEWFLKDDSRGAFAIFTSWTGDPRDWEILDELGDHVSRDLKIAFIFLAVYHSIPRD